MMRKARCQQPVCALDVTFRVDLRDGQSGPWTVELGYILTSTTLFVLP